MKAFEGLETGSVAEWERALEIADSFLRRWQDAPTVSHREELGADSAVVALRQWGTLRDKSRFPAFVRTIARRERCRVLRDCVRRREVGWESEPASVGVGVAEAEPQLYAVLGQPVVEGELLRRLPSALKQLTPLNACLLLSYYEGFSCTELAARFELCRDVVRARIGRSRGRVRSFLEETTVVAARRSSNGAARGRRSNLVAETPRQRR